LKLSRNTNINTIFKKLNETYGLEPKDVLYEGQPLFLASLMNLPGKDKEREGTLNAALSKLIEIEKETIYLDLTISFVKPGEKELLKEIPGIRIHFTD